MQTSDFLAFTALIISIYGIWMQNKGVQKQILAQNKGVRQQLLVANISEYTKRYQEIFEKLPKSVLDENFNLNSFSEDDKEKLLRSMWLYFDLCNEEYMLYHDLNLIDEKLWLLWEYAMTSAFKRPAFYQCWNVVFSNSFYPEPFSKYVNDKMIQLHNRGRQIYSNPK